MKEVILSLIDIIVADTKLAKSELMQKLQGLIAYISNILSNLDDALGGNVPVYTSGNETVDEIAQMVATLVKRFGTTLPISDVLKEILDYTAAIVAQLEADIKAADAATQAKPPVAATTETETTESDNSGFMESTVKSIISRLNAAKSSLATAPGSPAVSNAINHIDNAKKFALSIIAPKADA